MGKYRVFIEDVPHLTIRKPSGLGVLEWAWQVPVDRADFKEKRRTGRRFRGATLWDRKAKSLVYEFAPEEGWLYRTARTLAEGVSAGLRGAGIKRIVLAPGLASEVERRLRAASRLLKEAQRMIEAAGAVGQAEALRILARRLDTFRKRIRIV